MGNGLFLGIILNRIQTTTPQNLTWSLRDSDVRMGSVLLPSNTVVFWEGLISRVRAITLKGHLDPESGGQLRATEPRPDHVFGGPTAYSIPYGVGATGLRPQLKAIG